MTRREIIWALKDQIKTLERSYSHADGQVRDQDALWSILALRKSIEIVGSAPARPRTSAAKQRKKLRPARPAKWCPSYYNDI